MYVIRKTACDVRECSPTGEGVWKLRTKLILTLKLKRTQHIDFGPFYRLEI